LSDLSNVAQLTYGEPTGGKYEDNFIAPFVPQRADQLHSAVLVVDGEPVGLLQNVTYSSSYPVEVIIDPFTFERFPVGYKAPTVVISARQVAVISEIANYILTDMARKDYKIGLVLNQNIRGQTLAKQIDFANVKLTQVSNVVDTGGILIYKDVVFEGVLASVSRLNDAQDKPLVSTEFIKNVKEAIPIFTNEFYALIQGLTISYSQPVERVLDTSAKTLVGFYLGTQTLTITARTILSSTEIDNFVKLMTQPQKFTLVNSSSKALMSLLSNFKKIVLQASTLSYSADGLFAYKEVTFEAIPQNLKRGE
jgi:hypothetical protein